MDSTVNELKRRELGLTSCKTFENRYNLNRLTTATKYIPSIWPSARNRSFLSFPTSIDLSSDETKFTIGHLDNQFSVYNVESLIHNSRPVVQSVLVTTGTRSSQTIPPPNPRVRWLANSQTLLSHSAFEAPLSLWDIQNPRAPIDQSPRSGSSYYLHVNHHTNPELVASPLLNSDNLVHVFDIRKGFNRNCQALLQDLRLIRRKVDCLLWNPRFHYKLIVATSDHTRRSSGSTSQNYSYRLYEYDLRQFNLHTMSFTCDELTNNVAYGSSVHYPNLQFSSDGHVLCQYSSGFFTQWNTSTGKVVKSIQLEASIRHVRNRMGFTMSSNTGQDVVVMCTSLGLQMYNLSDMKRIAVIEGGDDAGPQMLDTEVIIHNESQTVFSAFHRVKVFGRTPVVAENGTNVNREMGNVPNTDDSDSTSSESD